MVIVNIVDWVKGDVMLVSCSNAPLVERVVVGSGYIVPPGRELGGDDLPGKGLCNDDLSGKGLDGGGEELLALIVLVCWVPLRAPTNTKLGRKICLRGLVGRKVGGSIKKFLRHRYPPSFIWYHELTLPYRRY